MGLFGDRCRIYFELDLLDCCWEEFLGSDGEISDVHFPFIATRSRHFLSPTAGGCRLDTVKFNFCLSVVLGRGSSVVIALFLVFCFGTFPYGGL